MSDNLLEKLIEKKPEFEDENGKEISIWNIKIYLKDGKLIALSLVLIIVWIVICTVHTPQYMAVLDLLFK